MTPPQHATSNASDSSTDPIPKATLPPLPNDQDASGRSFGPEHVELLRQVVESGVLTSTKGTFVKQLEEGFLLSVIQREVGIACPAREAVEDDVRVREPPFGHPLDPAIGYA